ncbi:dTMP kinase [Candidatus Gottesmanbacteria bacterium RBG_16_52_11]|uniref:Thymidylate kinase n=1 Tax=Candidatus Gottesmanbacteria bacterium RBG_16_52_11 TaxID=1798374 RepID=A0A1F5YPC7_9BACT|nr:MAG: dTMP kinase [Candidatus Gottesmanbacteria bacterium RBG_16_52_11]
MSKRGYFIVFEGGEGAGKSIQVEILSSHLREDKFPFVVTREPGGTRIGEQIRAITHNQDNVDLDPVTEAYLMAASRAQHVRETILPALTAGKIVICDRYVDSSIAYQGFGRQLGSAAISRLNILAVNGAVPDLTILLDVVPKSGLRRRRHDRGTKDRLDLQDAAFYERVYDGYRRISHGKNGKYVIIDASRNIEQVATAVWEIVRPKIRLLKKGAV